jgi:hypothetical protein
MVEGGSACWLDQNPDLHWYWDDNSYQITSSGEESKIFYYNGDHSAVRSSVSGMYESKWGSAPLMRHAPSYGPSTYNMQYRRYYKRTPPFISGPDYLCPNITYTFTM